MNSIYRSILARSLMTGVASLAFTMMGPAGVRAEIVIVQGDDGARAAIPVCPAATESRWQPTRAACTRLPPHSIRLRRPAEWRPRRQWRTVQTAATAAVAERQLRRRATAIISRARRKRTPILLAASGGARRHLGYTAVGDGGNGGAGGAATVATSDTRERQTAVPSPATRPRKVAREATEEERLFGGQWRQRAATRG